MYKSVKTIEDCEVLQKDLNQLHQWEKRWQLRFNARKRNIMRATHAKKKQLLYEYKLGNEALLPTNSTAYLGVELSKVEQPCEEDCLKGKSNTWQLQYGIHNGKDNIQLLEAVQRRAARFVCNK